ncbi:MAG TPA: ATP-binding protein [Thermoleophilaceae bacterium]|jgi:signal transduction histidine kinase|nr:ATP-binding protein [Thermoleophilaceae bacterium]
MTAATLAELRTVDLFAEIDDEQLAEWVDVTSVEELEPGDLLFEQGVEPPGLKLLLKGEALAILIDGDRQEPVGRQHGPTWMGAIAVLTGGPLGVRMKAETPCRVALIETNDFRRLAFAQPAIHQRVMQQVAPVMSRITGMEQQRERLTSLGTMAAGLAHELNNPAAAARRGAAQIDEALEVLASTVGRFVSAGIERDEAECLVELQEEAITGAERRTALDALDASDAEEELLARLEELEVPEAWRLAEPLAAAGVDRAWVDRVAEIAGSATDAAIAWVAAALTARALAAELQESTKRMSDLVGAVKTYAYMDRGELLELDVHEGIETTLKVLGHRLKHTEIEVVREYDKSLPKLTARGSELNQVWTNLLDNAIDALGESGTITIRTRREARGIRVDVADDGPGVPEDIRDRIFDSFFTTKEVGHGTGLGLATVHQIVVDRHRGRITVESEPGQTTFGVWLPLTQ